MISFYSYEWVGGDTIISSLNNGETEAQIPKLLGNLSRLPKAQD